MNAPDLKHYLEAAFEGAWAVESSCDMFFTYDPDGDLPEGWMPFATNVTGDHYDNVSALGRSAAYRLNIGLRKDTCQ